jgi:hypothetical protein
MPIDGKEWYRQNYVQIQEFRRYVETVERELWNELKTSIQKAAQKAARAISPHFKVSSYDRSGDVAYWYLPESYNDAREDKGIFISVWIPRENFAWLGGAANEIDDVPILGLWAKDANKERSKKLALEARNALTAPPQYVQVPVDSADDDGDDYYCLVEWDKRDLIQSLKKCDDMNDKLVTTFKTFTEFSLPALKAVPRQKR